MSDQALRTAGEIGRVLVANRGEIARRIFTTCRARGIETVAVHSDADSGAAFVREADAAVALPGTTPAETYLRGDLIVAAALSAGADAVHPGYGFLSENADFARAVAAAGLTWIGPDPESIETMGSKVESKALMAEAGVPVLERLDPAAIGEEHLPILVKASAGGGGRGMRVVERLADLDETVAAAAREAASAFGDDTVFCERYLPTGHHIEVQVFGDRAGTVWAVGERECSIQRRHQKVVEEAPAPLVERVGKAMRADLYEAARSAAARIGYVGAGTVEFLAADDGSFYFLEMNTRLQVEHPVTEATCGLDLVGLQLDIAAGAALGAEPGPPRGHAIEVRLYAEDPAEDWQPQSGPVTAFALPSARTAFRLADAGEPYVRLDAGIEAGEAITTFYDPMIAKIIGVAPTRRVAARVLAAALRTMQWDGPVTNAAMLIRVLGDEAFLTGETATTYFAEHPEVLGAQGPDDRVRREAGWMAAAAALAQAAAVEAGQPTGLSDMPVPAPGSIAAGERAGGQRSGEDALALAIARDNPRPHIGGWRLFHTDWTRRSARVAGLEAQIGYRRLRGGWELEPGTLPVGEAVEVVAVAPSEVTLRAAGVECRFAVQPTASGALVSSPTEAQALAWLPRYSDPAAEAVPGSLLAPMPGTVIRLEARVGERVEAGQPLLSIEAMKMEHTIRSDVAGTLTELRVAQGDQVDVGALVAVIADDGAPAEGGADSAGGEPAATGAKGRES
ncbi:ATP-grasp domain-containing protein [Brevibacterium sp. BRM-1]|uniref:ATP-binding protein n=1 Tax=Brevibacterium sp. BRM-1 TaxID=2999062 RepID=UPI002280FFA5|nr:biotin carboxylase N-terminal domain-containing protein [Brevibacterium sp. BRM-1]WAL40643.1 ATP-grasp domain-containing protein [Brevibacterium sp. BRM-1]